MKSTKVHFPHTVVNRQQLSIAVSCLLLLVLATALSGCSRSLVASDTVSEPDTPCSPAWYASVESRVATGDGQGHGPDPGSEEWRSVVEFRLGIRDTPGVPPLNSPAWCHYIDQLIHTAASGLTYE